LLVLSETTSFFENIAHMFTGMAVPDAHVADKSLERFLAKYYLVLCLFGPIVVLCVASAFYLRHFAKKINRHCSCSGNRGFVWRCQPSSRRARKPTLPTLDVI